MKNRIIYFLFAGFLAFSLSSCEKFLDVNDPNPNSATYSTPELILPQATAYVANNFVSYHGHGARLVGYHVNAGGYGGWGDTFTYEYTSASFNGFFNSAYDNLLDLEYVITASTDEEGALRPEYVNFYGAAKILKAYLYMNLVDLYNDVPYSEGAKGAEFITPKYDDAKTIYQGLAVELDEAIAAIKSQTVTNPLASSDVLFGGNMTTWIQFANTIKLKLYVQANGEGVFSGSLSVSSEGYLTDDALVDPGYERANGKQNPSWNSYHSTYTATAQVGFGRQWLPSRYTVAFYTGTKISDPLRGAATYRALSTTPVGTVPQNHLGNTPTPDNLPTVAGTLGSSPFYIGTPGAATGANNTIGTLKGSSMGQPIMLAAESYLLQAEAVVRGIIAGDAKSLFEKGIEASFRYLYKDVNGVVVSGKNPVADAATYISSNPNSRLVNFSLAASDEQRIEAIITQKYIAYNNIGGHIAWADFRRTGYPSIVPNGGPTETFVSIMSAMPTVDRLPGRILYPENESSMNAENVPQGISVEGSFVFWDRRN